MTDLRKQNSITINSQTGLHLLFGCAVAKTRLVSAQTLKTGFQTYGRKQFSVTACCRQRAQAPCKERRPRLRVQGKFAWPCKAKCGRLLGQRDSRLWLTSKVIFGFFLVFLRDGGRKGTVRVETFCPFFFIYRVLILCIATFIWHEITQWIILQWYETSLRAVMGKRTLN